MANPSPSTPLETDKPDGLQQLLLWTRQRVARVLDHWLPSTDQAPARLHEAMRYAALAGGKYVRPLLVYATGKALSVPADSLDGPACAVELIHAYSLLHDDLPAMDDDDLRRGKPSCHKVYGEAMAILGGDALQSLAFQILAEDPAITTGAAQRVAMIRTLAFASGSVGMAGGQAIDLEAVGTRLDLATLQDMHRRKTGALILAAVRLGALSNSDIGPETMAQLEDYGRCIGLAFQIRDDILDIEGDTAVLGKTTGVDVALNKPTYPSLLGLEGARMKAVETHEQALAAVEKLDERADPLRWISAYIVGRRH